MDACFTIDVVLRDVYNNAAVLFSVFMFHAEFIQATVGHVALYAGGAIFQGNDLQYFEHQQRRKLFQLLVSAINGRISKSLLLPTFCT